eukprot:5209616-Amphidinium_carterae.1
MQVDLFSATWCATQLENEALMSFREDPSVKLSTLVTMLEVGQGATESNPGLPHLMASDLACPDFGASLCFGPWMEFHLLEACAHCCEVVHCSLAFKTTCAPFEKNTKVRNQQAATRFRTSWSCARGAASAVISINCEILASTILVRLPSKHRGGSLGWSGALDRLLW